MRELVKRALKVARYVRLYGFSRTLVKVRTQYHLRRTLGFDGPVWRNEKASISANASVGVIGCGAFSYGVIGYYLHRKYGRVIRGVMDLDPARARSFAESYSAGYATIDADQILSDPGVDLVYVASNHASHADYAVRAIEAGKHVHVEKPHVINDEQLARLQAAMSANPHIKVFLGFNRPRSEAFSRLQKEVGREDGPMMINWFVIGHPLEEGHWYLDSREAGRILGNVSHWTDLTLEMVGREHAFPCRVVPLSIPGAKSDFITSLAFADGSLACLTFSAKGETLEGVRESLRLHRGDLILELADFHKISFERRGIKRSIRFLHRDHGHSRNVLNSFRCVSGMPGASAPNPDHVVRTAQLFLAAKLAHELQSEVTIGSDLQEPRIATSVTN